MDLRIVLAGGAALGAAGTILLWPKAIDPGLVLLAQAKGDLGTSEASTPARVAAMLAPFGAPPTADWCAAAVSTWLRQAAAALGRPDPVAGSAGAQALMRQFQGAGLWRSASELSADPGRVRIGMVPVWRRGPVGSWQGHTGVVASVQGSAFTSVEGNAQGQAVHVNAHNLADASLFGMGHLR